MRAMVLGVLLLLMPGVLAVIALRPEREVRAWPASPTLPAPTPVAYWDTPASESLATLREITVSEAKLAGPALAECEKRSGKLADKERNKAFRACALRSLARVEGFGTMNARLLMSLAGTAQDDCRERMMHLGGLTSTIGQTARSTLQGAMELEWADVLAGSKAIRSFARDASRLARERGWKSSCRALPERDRATGDEPVA
ncbi:hypothetical protein OJ998_29780 [Solirubrobacter taibaiensis]|nr:hypothetical protein [Solirubrobacter taibaiensis]